MAEKSALLVGIDAGGTTTDVVGTLAGTARRLVLPGVNARRDGHRRASQVLMEAVSQIRSHFGLRDHDRNVFVAAGVAGASSAEVRDAVSSGLAYPSRVVSDVELALFAAHGYSEGAVVIVGTGSNAAIRLADGSMVSRGGLGYILGDEASGYSLGRRAARLAASELDLGGTSSLGDAILTHMGVTGRESLLRVVYDEHFALSDLARIVVQHAGVGDETARRVLVDELQMLGKSLEALDRLRPRMGKSLQTCVVGGLSRYANYCELLVEEAFPPGWSLVAPRFTDQAEAAVALAADASAST